MCFGGKPKISAQKPPPAITPRQETDTNLPTKKDLVTDDTTLPNLNQELPSNSISKFKGHT